MRRKQIANYQAANQYLEQEYLPEHNRRFAWQPAQVEDYHGRKPTARELQEIFRLETERTISNDWVIRHEGRWMQLHPRQRRYGPTQCLHRDLADAELTTDLFIQVDEFREDQERAVSAVKIHDSPGRNCQRPGSKQAPIPVCDETTDR